MNVTVPHRQKGSALSSLRFAQGQALSAAKDLSAERDRPFASLRVTRWDCSNCERLFFTTEPCLNKLTRISHTGGVAAVGPDLSRPPPIYRPPRITKLIC